ncbi:MAG: hypothetical protein O2894_09630 [Planctomycetota bacterium]|nr:hypothetical protein [Planctomycetota bacterium]
MARRQSLLRALVLVALALGSAPACSGVESLSADASSLTAAERADVHSQVDKALEQKRYNVAWNQEAAAGHDRARLERVALEALRGRSRHAPGMFDALRTKFGALDAAARADVELLSRAAREDGRWQRALEIEIATADDPPAYRAAWAVYRDAPPDVAPGLLAAIGAAKAAHAESAD